MKTRIVIPLLAFCRMAAAADSDQWSLHAADAEWRLTLKTTPACRGAVEAFLAAHHPYTLPQVLWQELQGGPAYAAWVRAEVSAPAGADPTSTA